VLFCVHALWEIFCDFIVAVARSCESCGLWLWVVVHCGKISMISLQQLPICVAIVGFCVFIAGFCGLAVWLYNMGLNMKKGDDNMGQWVIGYGPRVHGPFCYQCCYARTLRNCNHSYFSDYLSLESSVLRVR
jgi:hypothetical protein